MTFMEAAGRRREYEWAGSRPVDAPMLVIEAAVAFVEIITGRGVGTA